MKILLFGATGMVGKAVLEQALLDSNISQVIAPTRRALTIEHEKLDNPVIDFTQLEQIDWWPSDAVICALGTTRKQAGSRDAFKAVDLNMVSQIAQHSKAAGTERFVLNSSVGAHTGKGLYLATKKAAEEAVAACGFQALTLIRPGLIDASNRPDFRLFESLALGVLRPFSQLIPVDYRPIEPKQIALHMLHSALHQDGLLKLENPDLHKPLTHTS